MPYADTVRRKEFADAYRASHRSKANATARAWRKANPEKHNENCRKAYAGNPDRDRERYYTRVYGISIAQYQTMFSQQGGVCALCGRPPKRYRLAVEHDHGPSKRVRGLTCQFCNRYLIGKNTAETAKKVLAYLESTFDGRTL